MKHLTIGERVKQFREYFGYTQEKLGEIIGMSRGNISKIEKDLLPPSNAFLNALKDRFAANPNWIKTGEEDMWISPESYLSRGIELLGKEKMAAGIVNLLKSQEFGDVKALAGLNKMLDSGIPDEVAKYLRYVIDTWNHGDEKTRHWMERQLEMAFRDVK